MIISNDNDVAIRDLYDEVANLKNELKLLSCGVALLDFAKYSDQDPNQQAIWMQLMFARYMDHFMFEIKKEYDSK